MNEAQGRGVHAITQTSAVPRSLGIFVYVFIFQTRVQASYEYDREIPWPVLAARPTMIHEKAAETRLAPWCQEE